MNYKNIIFIYLLTIVLFTSCFKLKKYSGTDNGKDTPEKWGYNYKNITLITKDNIKISAWEIIQDKNNPWIIIMPGFQDNKSDDKIRIVFKKLAPSKYNFILIDPRGFGNSGGFTSFGILEKYEILSAVHYIRKNKYKSKIGLIGFSLGASASIFAAALSKEISALALWAPYADLKDEIKYFLKWKIGNSKKKLLIWAKNNPDKIAVIFERHYRVNLSKNKPVDYIKKIKIPILLGHGINDKLIPYYNSQKLLNANKKIQFIKLSGGHSLYYQDKNERNGFLNKIAILMWNNLR